MDEITSEREKFLTEIERIFKEHQFEKVDNSFVCIQQHEQPGATININGQVIQQQPTYITNIFVATLLGEGYVSDVDEENKQYFEQVRYEIFQNDVKLSVVEECIYYDEFDKIMKNFLQ